MTIYKDDIKLFESKVMTDEDDGGGAMTSVEIVSGEHNSIFPDISDLDRAYGVVGIRSVHLKVDSNANDTYFGSTVGLIETPADENVDITLMSENDPYATREETKEIIEKYLTSGIRYQGVLFYDQIAGQRMIRIMQYTTTSVPSAGEVLILSEGDNTQYVKLTDVEYETQTFKYSNNGSLVDYYLRIVTCEISEALRYTFSGEEPSGVLPKGDTAINETMVADAAQYYGMKTVTKDAEFNTSVIQADSIYNQLVPATRVDTAQVNVPIVEVKSAPVDINAAGTESTEISVNLESLSFTVDIDNQGYVFVQTLTPVPTAGTTRVSFMSGGNWYVLEDDGTGILKGSETAYGTGSIDSLGNVSITLGSLPDITSEVIFQWGSTDILTELVVDDDLDLESEVTYDLSVTPNINDMTFTWDDKTATCSNGVISGDATGSVLNKKITFEPDLLPAAGTTIDVAWTESMGGVTQGYTETVQVDIVDDGNYYTFNRGDVLKSSLAMVVTPADYNVDSNGHANYSSKTRTVYITFGSSGLVYVKNGGVKKVCGTYNTDTQAVAIQKSLLLGAFTAQSWGKKHSHWYSTHRSWTITSRRTVYVACNAVHSYVTYTQSVATVISPPVEAGTDSFTFDEAAITFSDRGIDVINDTIKINFNGMALTIDNDIDVKNGDKTVGSFDATENKMTLTTWATGTDTLTINTGLYSFNEIQYAQDMVFVTIANPVASRSLQINAIDINGDQCSATTDSDGNISGGGFEGSIDVDMGIVLLSNDNLVQSMDIKYNCVTYNYLPLDADQLGLDPIRLPVDGRVVIFKKGDVVVIHQDNTEEVTVTPGQVVDLDEVRLVSLSCTATDAVLDADLGTVTFPTAGSYTIDYRFEDMVLLTYVDISGALKTSRALSHTYTADKAKVSSVLIAGNLVARYTNLFDQSSWTGTFSDSLIGNGATVSYNDTAYPITVTNEGCATERMAIIFTSSTSFKLIGENIGQIAVGDVNTDFAPINPVSGEPYFFLNHLGWGSGWSTNNCLRIDFYGAVYQLNVIRTILQGDNESGLDSDKFALQIRGNINQTV